MALDRFEGTKQKTGAFGDEQQLSDFSLKSSAARQPQLKPAERRDHSDRAQPKEVSRDHLHEDWAQELPHDISLPGSERAEARLVDPASIQSEPLSPGSSKFIEDLKKSISQPGRPKSLVKEQRAPVTEKGEDTQLSGEWRPVEGQEEEAPTPRPVMPPAAMRKKKKQVVEQPLISLEDRLAGENIIAKRIEEEEKIRLQRLKEKTSGGQYHVYLIIYAICIVLAFLAQRVENEDMRNATHTSGRSVANAVDRIMLPKTFSNFATGLRYYEDEATKDIAKRGPSTFASNIGGGIEAAVKVSTTDAPAKASPTRKGFYQLWTGFFLGFPASALYVMRQVYVAAIVNKSGLELLLNLLMYLSLFAVSAMVYFKIQQRWNVMPKSLAPIIIVLLMSLTSTIISAVIAFSSAICKVPMPDTIELFTAIAIIAISGLMARIAFLAPKAKGAEGRQLISRRTRFGITLVR